MSLYNISVDNTQQLKFFYSPATPSDWTISDPPYFYVNEALDQLSGVVGSEGFIVDSTNHNVLGPSQKQTDPSSGTDNLIVGLSSPTLTSGSSNTIYGISAGSALTTQSNNVLIGYNAGNACTASGNIFVGSSAGSANTTGTANVFIGTDSGINNTVGSSNTFIGQETGNNNSTGNYNTIIGCNAGNDNTTGNALTALGFQAGYQCVAGTTSGSNTFIGYLAGSEITSGTGNIFLGSNANVTAGGAAYSNLNVIGNGITGATGNASFMAPFRNSTSSTSIVYSGDDELIADSSSIRYKQNIKLLDPKLSENIYKLNLYTYNMKDENSSIESRSREYEIGMLAEELHSIYPQFVGLDKEMKPTSIAYGKLTTLLISECKKLKEELGIVNDKLDILSTNLRQKKIL